MTHLIFAPQEGSIEGTDHQLDPTESVDRFGVGAALGGFEQEVGKEVGECGGHKARECAHIKRVKTKRGLEGMVGMVWRVVWKNDGGFCVLLLVEVGLGVSSSSSTTLMPMIAPLLIFLLFS